MTALLPTSDRAAVWGRVPVPDADRVAFICIDDGYAVPPEQGGDPIAAAEYVEATNLAVTPFLSYYAASSGYYPPPTATTDPAAYAHLQYLRRFPLGHGVQCHSRTHVDLTGVESGGPPLTYDQQYNEISKGKGFLARGDAFGSTPTLFRPPYGRWNDDTRRAAYAAGIKVILHWTHTYSQIVEGKEVRPGDILLLHFNPDLLDQLTAAKAACDAAGLTPAYIADYVR